MTARYPIHFQLGEMFYAKSDPELRACIVTNFIDELGHYGDLVDFPSGDRFTVNRTLLDTDWQPMVCDGPWYVEQYSAHGDRADWGANVPNIEFVIAIAKAARHRGLGESIRFRTDEPISPQDLGRLRFVNATRLR